MNTATFGPRGWLLPWFQMLGILVMLFSGGQWAEGQPVRNPKHASVDPIDAVTGVTHLDDQGLVPPRRMDYSPPSFRQLETDVLWREIERSSGLAIIVLRRAGQTRGYFNGKVLVTDNEVAKFSRTLRAQYPGLRSNREIPKVAMPKMGDGRRYPGVVMRIADLQTLEAVRRDELVDTIEPLIFMDGLGCGSPVYHTQQGAFTTDGHISPPSEMSKPPSVRAFDIVPYTYAHLGIEKAWKRQARPGKGIPVAVLDTGISAGQDQLNGRFRMENNVRPPADHLNQVKGQASDDCGHGTRIAGTITAPLDGRNIVGVAWAAPLTTIKVGDGVIHQGVDSVRDTCDAIKRAQERGARVISMAFGMLYTSDRLQDCIKEVWNRSPEVLMVAAAGTTVAWVVFPASMGQEVIAASQVEISPNAPGYKMFPLSQVAYSPQVDFVIPDSTNDTPTTGRLSPDIASLGGTSSATAHLAGMFAVLWSKYPNESRAQIVARMRASSSLSGITDQGGLPAFADLGAGIPNLYRATGGSTQLEIRAPDVVQVGTQFRVEAIVDGSDPLQYSWTPGSGTGAANLMMASAIGAMAISVSTLDGVDGNKLQASKTIQVVPGPPPPTLDRWLFSVETISEYAVFYDGNRLDRKVNAGRSVPPGCSVLLALGQLLDGNLQAMPGVQASATLFQSGTRGYTVTLDEPSNPRSLQSNVHVWHSGVSDVRVKVQYLIRQPAGTDCNVAGFTQSAI